MAALFFTVGESYSAFSAIPQPEDDFKTVPDNVSSDSFCGAFYSTEDHAIAELKLAVEDAKAAGSLNPQDTERRTELATSAERRITSAMNLFEKAAQEAKTGECQDAYYPKEVDRTLDELLKEVVVPRRYGTEPETEPDEDIDADSVQLEKGAIDVLRQAIKDAREAGATDVKDVEGREAKEREARDQALNAIADFESARRSARLAGQARRKVLPSK